MFSHEELFKTRKQRKTKYFQGIFSPSNPGKYVGDYRMIVYRSSWEFKLMHWMDRNPNVISWSSEETIIPYKSPLDKRIHRYFVDFKIKIRTKEGIKTYLIEVKPFKQTVPPEKPKKIGPRYEKAVLEYMKNDAKWEAARAYCKQRDMEFVILTEKQLFDQK